MHTHTQVLNNGSSQSQSMAIDVLAMVMEMGPPETATVLLDAGVVQSLISMLLSPSALVQQQAVGLVSIIASRYVCMHAVVRGCCYGMVVHQRATTPIFTYTYSNLHTLILLLFTPFARHPHSYAVAVALCEEGALGPLVQYLLGENVLAKEYASTALASIARQEESLVKHIAATPDAIRVLAQLLRSSSVVCQQNATFILGRIASLGGEYEAEIACTTVISPVVQLLYFGSTPDIKLFAAQLLATICEYVVVLLSGKLPGSTPPVAPHCTPSRPSPPPTQNQQQNTAIGDSCRCSIPPLCHVGG